MNKSKILGTIKGLVKHEPTRWSSDNGYDTVVYSYLAPIGKGFELAKKLERPETMPNFTIDCEEDEALALDLVTITYKYQYNEPTDPDNPGEGGGDGGDGGDGGPGGDGGSGGGEEKSIEINVFCTEESLFTHPKYKKLADGAPDPLLQALAGLSNGNLTDEYGVKYTDTVKTQGATAIELAKKFMRGQTKWHCPRTDATITSPSPISGTPGKIGGAAGLGNLPEGQKWLCLGNTLSKRGGRRVYTAKFLSGIWDEDIYGG